MIGPRPASRWRRRAFGTLGAALAAVWVPLLAAGCQETPSGPALTLEHNGLLADFPFTMPLPASSLTPTFRLGGTAGSADSSVELASDGLHVAVGPHELGTWKGYFVATAATFPASAVFHVQMGRPPAAVPRASQSGIALLAVQTAASPVLDYVLVAGLVSRAHRSWIVGYANGNTAYATTKPLSIMPLAATREDVTLQTDGNSRFSVYFGDRLVYRSTALRLHVTPPLRVYLEVEARGLAYQARFQDFWVAASDVVRIDDLPPGEHVTLTPRGEAPLHAIANADGQARLRMPVTEAVGTGTFSFSRRGTRALHFSAVAFSGGDVFDARL